MAYEAGSRTAGPHLEVSVSLLSRRVPAMFTLAVLGLAAAPARAGSFTAGLGLGWVWMDPSENLDSTWTVVPRRGPARTAR